MNSTSRSQPRLPHVVYQLLTIKNGIRLELYPGPMDSNPHHALRTIPVV